MDHKFYRIRGNPEFILDEIFNQYIFFSSPEKLNDPMEGFRDIFWSGDEIIWTNFFKHYLYCLERVYVLLIIKKDTYNITQKDIPIFNNLDDFPTNIYAELFDEIVSLFWQEPNVKQFIKGLSSLEHQIRKKELITSLRTIHQYAIDIIFKVYQKNNLIPTDVNNKLDPIKLIDHYVDNDIFGCTKKLVEKNKDTPRATEALFETFESISTQSILTHRCTELFKENEANSCFVLFEFPEHFLKQLELIMYPEWYSASFMDNCTNSSVWGHYGNSHKGVCLVFNANSTTNNHSLKLSINIPEDNRSPSKELTFHKINYGAGFPPVDFFRSIGRLTHHQLMSDWYSDKDKTSSCVKILESEDEWRKQYWQHFFKTLAIKTKDWQYENESRLILIDTLIDLSDSNKRKLQYDFSSLDGIIFGINTPEELKKDIIRIIFDKCKKIGRKNFSFYQAYYNPKDQTIKHNKLSLIKF